MKLTNNRYEVTFTAKGGEIKSFTDLETGIQYMWQGHPDYWTGKNPGLFPLVGNTLDGTYEMDGKTYAMKITVWFAMRRSTVYAMTEKRSSWHLTAVRKQKRSTPSIFIMR